AYSLFERSIEQINDQINDQIIDQINDQSNDQIIDQINDQFNDQSLGENNPLRELMCAKITIIMFLAPETANPHLEILYGLY
ncbi:MAG: hypothetical protein LBE27_02215, partial [Deltaproteobacteria bacterium]|nr:hypothetical protein [Deltaproteobacteria bacterium]